MESTPPPQAQSGSVSKGTVLIVIAFCIMAALGTAIYVFYRFAEYDRKRGSGVGIGSTENGAATVADTAERTAALDLPADYRRVPDSVSLTNQSGKSFKLGDLRGSVVVVDFFFTRCTGPCPMMNRNMAQVAGEFASEPGVKFLSITVDPVYDTPKELAAYARTFEADSSHWVFANAGSPQSTYNLAADGFGMSAGERSQPDTVATIFHDERYVILDRKGGIRAYVHVKDPQWKQHTIERVRSLLHEEK